ncbi:UDP-N-acetylglucosamine 2-epimerase [Geomonas sp. Red32]|uniref:UDP-N-acetylglucosamine 2-epimerase n=1 Tax=Geomonas sp. Red32 TaxID=2912856 RepID=UPI00202D0575|nr:UDP-N-acetylglucosamine 2-epimerase [Geomonas sp. Red32]MCM0083481.1 UDP-N-acetylglucosamine 2-epimerase [Geomonas sp. Red32]
MARKILFLTSTRADFGKLKSLMHALDDDPAFEVHVFVTGMHVLPKYGNTGEEVEKCGFKNIYRFINQKSNDDMGSILANTVQGLSNYVELLKPDMLVIHGDRAEALAGAIVGAFSNVLVSHIEGGEVSGTIDESIRHSVSKLAHIHFVANERARRRLIQMGEHEENIFIIGSPDIDLMTSSGLPSLASVKEHYEISFDSYGIFVYHPVTTKLHDLMGNLSEISKALVSSGRNYVAIYPNNDPGSELIIEELTALRDNPALRIFPSIRFEAFLVLLKHADFMIGNSSAGVREAPFYGIPSINLGSRQNGRFCCDTIINCRERVPEIEAAISQIAALPRTPTEHFGNGTSKDRFLEIVKGRKIWGTNIQKYFVDQAGFEAGGD